MSAEHEQSASEQLERAYQRLVDAHLRLPVNLFSRDKYDEEHLNAAEEAAAEYVDCVRHIRQLRLDWKDV